MSPSSFRLIHQAHVRMISETPALKDGTSKELRRLHDTAQQHLHALKAMGYEPPGLFVTSLLELKLDTNTMFEWQRHSQESADVPHFSKLLEFLNLRAQASETSVSHPKGSPRSGNPSDRRGHHPSKSVTAFTSNTALIASSVEQTSIHSTSARCSSLSLMRRCYPR